jgi:hypothetical protein
MVALMIDGMHVEEHVLLVALAIDSEGKKHVLGLHEGATENAASCRALISELQDRGLRTDKPILAVIDGSKALARAISNAFGGHLLIQRCQARKLRNASEHSLPLDLHADGDRLALQITADSDTHEPPSLDPAQRIVNALAVAHTPVPLAEIREACRIRTARLCHELAALVDAGRVLKAEGGYLLAPPSS